MLVFGIAPLIDTLLDRERQPKRKRKVIIRSFKGIQTVKAQHFELMLVGNGKIDITISLMKVSKCCWIDFRPNRRL